MDSEEDGDQKKKKKESQRPNYFVSIPITNTQVGKPDIGANLHIFLCLSIMLRCTLKTPCSSRKILSFYAYKDYSLFLTSLYLVFELKHTYIVTTNESSI